MPSRWAAKAISNTGMPTMPNMNSTFCVFRACAITVAPDTFSSLVSLRSAKLLSDIFHSRSRQQADTGSPCYPVSKWVASTNCGAPFLRLTGRRQPTALNSRKEGGTKTSPRSGRGENVNTLSPIRTAPCCTLFRSWDQCQESGPARDRGLCPAGLRSAL